MSQELILTIGCQGSGKSTWANKYIEQHPNVVYLSPDKLRAEFGKGVHDQDVNAKVFDAMKIRLTNALSLGKSVLLDATFIKKKWRTPNLKIGRQFGAKLIAHAFYANRDTLIKRVQSRAQQGGLNVPIEVIDNYLNSLEPPTNTEFDEIINHR